MRAAEALSPATAPVWVLLPMTPVKATCVALSRVTVGVRLGVGAPARYTARMASAAAAGEVGQVMFMTGVRNRPWPMFTAAPVPAPACRPLPAAAAAAAGSTMDRSRRGIVRVIGLLSLAPAPPPGTPPATSGDSVTTLLSRGRPGIMSSARVGLGATASRLLWLAWEAVVPPLPTTAAVREESTEESRPLRARLLLLPLLLLAAAAAASVAAMAMSLTAGSAGYCMAARPAVSGTGE